MAQNEIQISSDQAKIFARRIYRDVAAYIQSHQQEYHEFLAREENREPLKEETNS